MTQNELIHYIWEHDEETTEEICKNCNVTVDDVMEAMLLAY